MSSLFRHLMPSQPVRGQGDSLVRVPDITDRPSDERRPSGSGASLDDPTDEDRLEVMRERHGDVEHCTNHPNQISDKMCVIS